MAGVVGHVCWQCLNDHPVVSSDLSIALWLVCKRGVIPNRHHLAYVDEKLLRKEASVVCYEFRRRSTVKDIGIGEVSGHFRGFNKFHQHSVRHLTEQVSNYQDVYITSFCLDALAENVITQRR